MQQIAYSGTARSTITRRKDGREAANSQPPNGRRKNDENKLLIIMSDCLPSSGNHVLNSPPLSHFAAFPTRHLFFLFFTLLPLVPRRFTATIRRFQKIPRESKRRCVTAAKRGILTLFGVSLSSSAGVNFLSRPVSDPEHSLPHSWLTSWRHAAPPSSGWPRPARGRHDGAEGGGGVEYSTSVCIYT